MKRVLGGNPGYPDIKRLVVGGPKGKSMVQPLIMGQRRNKEGKSVVPPCPTNCVRESLFLLSGKEVSRACRLLLSPEENRRREEVLPIMECKSKSGNPSIVREGSAHPS